MRMIKSYPLVVFILCACLFNSCHKRSRPKTEKPHILLIFTDQQNIDMMSAMGNSLLRTPNMDRLAKRGVMFKQAYCTSPVCGPARSSIITGRMPHETGVEWNGDSLRASIKTVGEIFRDNGYQTTWAGKWHLPESYPQRAKARNKVTRGFDLLPFRDPEIDNWMLGTETDPPLTDAVVSYLSAYEAEKPLFLAVSYHNPHDICFYARKNGWVDEKDSLLEIRYYGFEYKLPEVIGMHPNHFMPLPALPPNHAIDEGEPEFISDKRIYHKEYGLETHLAFHEFSDLEWQGYLHAYCRLTEMVDQEIGKVLDALESNDRFKNTMIVFTSDHGDGAAAHKWSAKLSLYKESAMIPMIISYPGSIPANIINGNHLVSQIDIVPTLSDYAGIRTEEKFTGKSWRTIIDDPDAVWRSHVVVELADYKPDKSRKGRMIRDEKFKYHIFSSGNRNEQLFDLENDPDETKNLAYDPNFQSIKVELRDHLQVWMKKTNDSFEY